MISVGRTSEVRGPHNVISWFKVTEFAQNLAYLYHTFGPICALPTFNLPINHSSFSLPKSSLSRIFLPYSIRTPGSLISDI